MRVILAGFNIDSEIIKEARDRGVDPDRLSPETLSAAYARISRDPAPVDELRAQARTEVASARASNERIVFGMGHASVAEHAVFNFDLIGISRYAIEAVEHFRLCSYTEKSQRYIKLQDDVVLPQEIAKVGLAEPFKELVALQHRTYHQLYEKLKAHLQEHHPEMSAKRSSRQTLDGWAKEDARYVTSLAVEGQLGMTLNARNLELMIRRLARHPLAELQKLAATLREQAQAVTPSLIRYTEPDHQKTKGADELARIARLHLSKRSEQATISEALPAQLVHATPQGDAVVVAALLSESGGASWPECFETAVAMSSEEHAEVIRLALRHMKRHDSPPRAFEMAEMRFDLIVSSSCYAQLKRHRMSTQLAQAYDPMLGYTVPEAIKEIGEMEAFQQVMTASAKLSHEIALRDPQAAPYALTQAHRRRVLLQMNAREIYHFSRLREDQHAQWDIRQLAHQMLELARERLPLTLMLACGKDAFEERRREVMPEARG